MSILTTSAHASLLAATKTQSHKENAANKTVLLFGILTGKHVLDVLFTFMADEFQQVCIGHQNLIQLECPRLRVRLGVVDSDLNFQVAIIEDRKSTRLNSSHLV